MLELRKRTNLRGGVDHVPALRLEMKDVPPGAKVRVRGDVGEPFKGLELDVEAGEDFEVHSFTVDGEDQIAVSPVEARYIHGGPVQLPFAGEEMAMVVRNPSLEKKTFRCFVLGRIREQWETPR
jgi:hypothetical protein